MHAWMYACMYVCMYVCMYKEVVGQKPWQASWNEYGERRALSDTATANRPKLAAARKTTLNTRILVCYIVYGTVEEYVVYGI